MTFGEKVGINYETPNGNHLVLMNKITLKTTISVRGKISTKLLYQVMDPSGGGRYRFFYIKNHPNAKILRLFKPYSY